MGVNGIAFAVVFVKDYERMKSFYERVFGRKGEEAHPPEEWASWNFPGTDSGFAIHGGAVVTQSEIAEWIEAKHGAEAVRHPTVLPVLTVVDIRKTVDEMRSAGVEITRDVYEEQPGLLAADINDPEGNPINLVEVGAPGSHR